MDFSSSKSFRHEEVPKIGILLANLGTPDAPDTPALRRYLAEFLADERVIEEPRWKWLPILHGIVLRTRPAKSAALYQEIWTDDGSPLLVTAKKQRDALRDAFSAWGGEVAVPVHIEIGMRYGNPSLRSGMEKLREAGVRKLLVVPLYPQYSGSSTASVYDEVFDVLKSWRVIPDLRALMSYHDHPLFIDALVDSIENSWKDRSRPEKLVFSYHGIPLRYLEGGDPYHCHCHKTTRLVTEKLGLSEDQYITTFQSVFGKERWIRPATDKTLEDLAKQGLKSLDVVCPGFSADCLETIEEIDQENREIFLSNGGETFNYISALNYNPKFIDALLNICTEELAGWLPTPLGSYVEEIEENASKCEYLYQELAKKKFNSR